MLSGDLIEELTRRTKQSNETARKQLSRASGEVMRVSGFFMRNQSLFYLEGHVKDGSYIEVLKESLKSSAKRLFAVIRALEFHKGFIVEEQLPAYLLSPIENLKGNKRVDMVLKDIAKIELIGREGEYIKLNEDFFPKARVNFKHFKAIQMARDFILDQFMDWAKMIGLVSFDKATLYSEYGKFQWAFTAPSYITTLTEYKKDGLTPAFVLADILIGTQVKDDDIVFFIEKLKIVKAVNKKAKILPFLILDNISPTALATLKEQGVVVGFVNKLFGNGYSELIKILINTVAHAGAILKKNPGEFLSLMEKISTLVGGKTNNLRGDVFELAVGYYHSRRCKNLDVSKDIFVNGLPLELDVFAVYVDEVKVCECRGYKSQLTIGDIDVWLKKIVRVREWIDQQEAYKEKRHVFEIWSTGGFTKEAREKLEVVSKAKRYDILYFDEVEILKKAKEIPGGKFVKILQQYFVKEPV